MPVTGGRGRRKDRTANGSASTEGADGRTVVKRKGRGTGPITIVKSQNRKEKVKSIDGEEWEGQGGRFDEKRRRV